MIVITSTQRSESVQHVTVHFSQAQVRDLENVAHVAEIKWEDHDLQT